MFSKKCNPMYLVVAAGVFLLVLLLSVLFAFSSSAFAHSGRLNKDGCHYDRDTKRFHWHQKGSRKVAGDCRPVMPPALESLKKRVGRLEKVRAKPARQSRPRERRICKELRLKFSRTATWKQKDKVGIAQEAIVQRCW